MCKNASTFENEFVKEYATDRLYKKIISELSGRKDRSKGGQKIKLTPEMLRQFLFYVSIGEDLKNAAELVYMGEKTRQDYNSRSETFSGVTSLAKANISLRAKIAIARAIEGQKAGFYHYTHPAIKQPIYIEKKEVLPNVQVAMWWLERHKEDEDSKNDSKINNQLGVPQT